MVKACYSHANYGQYSETSAFIERVVDIHNQPCNNFTRTDFFINKSIKEGALMDRRGGFTSDFLAGCLEGKTVKDYLESSLLKVMDADKKYEGNLFLTSTPSRRPHLVRNICTKMKSSAKKIIQFYQEAQDESGMGRFEGLEHKFSEMLQLGFDEDITCVKKQLPKSYHLSVKSKSVYPKNLRNNGKKWK